MKDIRNFNVTIRIKSRQASQEAQTCLDAVCIVLKHFLLKSNFQCLLHS
jgi:hypothetical protein